MKQPVTDKQFLLMLAVYGVIAYVVGSALAKGVRAISEGVGDIGDAITPTNPDNIFYRGVNGIGDSLDDGANNDSFSLGGWLYDITHQ